MRILLWHVHGSWTTSFVQGKHDYLLPVNAGRDAWGRGRATSWDWPPSVVERSVAELAGEDLDVVLLQRPEESELVRRWTGRTPGRDLPAVYVEHNTPGTNVPFSRHPLADGDITIAHVTHFNHLIWDTGSAPTTVIEHGIVDPGHLYTGDWPRAAVVVNDPVRRSRAVGADLFARFAQAVPLDVFGMRVESLRDAARDIWAFENLSQAKMHAELARRRVYLHTARWTSLGLALIEAMQLGMPVVVLSATEAPRAVPPAAGVLSADVDELVAAARRFVHEPMLAQQVGSAARAYALEHYGLGRFLADWDALLDAVG